MKKTTELHADLTEIIRPKDSNTSHQKEDTHRHTQYAQQIPYTHREHFRQQNLMTGSRKGMGQVSLIRKHALIKPHR